MNDVAAMGQVSMWRDQMVESLAVAEGDTVLDLAAGTGTSSAALARAGARVVAADFSLGMMTEGRRRGAPVPFVGADAQHLPFLDDSFDAAVISFGLRNVHEPRMGLQEMVRVVRPGGTVVVCEFSTPTNPLFRTVYERYLLRALPAAARALSSNSDAYDYLAESILDGPARPSFAPGSSSWDSSTASTGTSPAASSRCIADTSRATEPAGQTVDGRAVEAMWPRTPLKTPSQLDGRAAGP